MVLAITPRHSPCTVAIDNIGGPSCSHQNRLIRFLHDCTDMSQLKQIHAQTLRTTSTGNNSHTIFIYSRILQVSSMADTGYAFRVFDQIEHPNSFMWNTLIRGCARSVNHKQQAIQLYCKMLEEGIVKPDKYTYPFVLKACAYLFSLSQGEQLQAQVIKSGLGSDVYISNSLIHFYASCGHLELAHKVFEKMSVRSLVSWNAIIDAFVQFGEFENALKLFREMQNMFEPDGYTMQSIINSCAGIGALSLGMWAHSYILSMPDPTIASDILVASHLIYMYCKCGSLEIAQQVFERMPSRDITSWNSMILGYAMHGQAKAALECFARLIKTESFNPNPITFVGVLSACNHAGIVSEGLKYFELMVKEYKIQPQLEHYGCLVDLLARAGFINEALNFVTNMPMKPDAVIWRSLLNACSKQRASVELSEKVARQILESEGAASSGVYVLMSRVYASASRWDDVGLVRKLMTEEGIAKEPGCSLIEVDGITHEFFAGDSSHPECKEIYRFLDVIKERLELMRYSPDFSQAPLVNEGGDTKQHSLDLHSERIALAFGLLKLKPGIPVRIFKNLRVCNDCHTVFKLISSAFNVDIIMRDRARFHHFSHGTCSCMDYW
ncbi:pentatricopeptide repeat-containing protein At1g59720, chloroplastic/mitochondrial [Humulus lupulus]|uniref:pentatricopeptide repeat-containing protein At1g59720, chloroplastic/mitochondrial n=1 Tax=Humulus lupulus TaxID=3486 RepID=UPI002B40840B|nr:pentatricopeptide repeat-containing protein At1g59720, chloroplastic/mitochondrial [Humulus lupulus]